MPLKAGCRLTSGNELPRLARIFQLSQRLDALGRLGVVSLAGARNRLSSLGMSLGVRNGGLRAMPTGTIARLLIDKGFGFIRDEGGIEHFFHRSSVRGAVFELLREGQRVEFTQEDSQKGPRAGDVRLIEARFDLSTPSLAPATASCEIWDLPGRSSMTIAVSSEPCANSGSPTTTNCR